MSDDMGAVHRCFAVEDHDLEIHEARVLPRYSESHAGVRRLRDVGDAVQDTPKGLS